MLKAIRAWIADQATWRKLQSIKDAVDDRLIYKNTGVNKWIYVQPTTLKPTWGDCQAYSETYRIDAQDAGFTAVRHTYELPDGTYHAVAVVRSPYGDYVMDCRQKKVVKA